MTNNAPVNVFEPEFIIDQEFLFTFLLVMGTKDVCLTLGGLS